MRTPLTRTTLVAAAIGAALLLAACGGSNDAEVVATPAETPAPAADSGPVAIDVLSGDTSLGPVLVGPDGHTLYAFTNDIEAVSTCYGTCADAWPPVIVSDDWTAGPGLDFGIFATTVREDGQRQLVAGRWPLYYFAGDAAPGDVQGQGSGDVWFAVDLDGILIRDAIAEAQAQAPAADDPATSEDAAAETGDEAGADDGYGSSDGNAGGDGNQAMAGPALVASAETGLGTALVDETGLTLYGFLDDRDAPGPTCNGACADAWPPVLVDGDALPAGLDPAVFSVVTRDDGTNQLAAGIWPLYRFAGDAAPGDVNGQGSGDVWFVAAPDGSLIR